MIQPISTKQIATSHRKSNGFTTTYEISAYHH